MKPRKPAVRIAVAGPMGPPECGLLPLERDVQFCEFNLKI
jgi:hypothetical protein